MAVSLRQPGADRSFEIDALHAPVVRGVVFSRAFFDRVATAVVSPVMWKSKWRILPVGEVHDQPGRPGLRPEATQAVTSNLNSGGLFAYK